MKLTTEEDFQQFLAYEDSSVDDAFIEKTLDRLEKTQRIRRWVLGFSSVLASVVLLIVFAVNGVVVLQPLLTFIAESPFLFSSVLSAAVASMVWLVTD